jgi:hypothetical protein
VASKPLIDTQSCYCLKCIPVGACLFLSIVSLLKCARVRVRVYPIKKIFLKKIKKLLKNPLKTLYFFIFLCYYVRALDMRRQKIYFSRY